MALKVDFEKVQAVIDNLMQDDIIEVHWADASKNRRVRKITNKVVACYKKQTGTFLMLIHDTAYGIEHLLMEDLSEGSIELPTIWSIPRPCILYVEIITSKPLKFTSDVGTLYLGGDKVKTMIREGGVGARIEKIKGGD